MRKGFTLVECMLASAIFGLLTLVLFEGVIVATRIAHENAETLAAESVAWDVAWTRFHVAFDDLVVGSSRRYTLTAEQAPALVRSGYADPEATVTVGLADEAGFSASGSKVKKITVDLEWGPEGRRRLLSDSGSCPQVFRGCMGRDYLQ